jgi:PAS domain S-box-containing protein
MHAPVARIAACVAAAIAVPVLIGWHVGAWRIVRPLPDATPMVYNTALCITLCALAVITGRGRRLLTGATLLIAGLTLVEYATGRSLGINTAIVSQPAPVSGSIMPVQMAPNTAVALILISTALLLFVKEPRDSRATHVSGICLSIAAALPIVSGVGYFTGVPSGYAWGQLIGMAPHTAVALVVLAIGLLWEVCVITWTSGERSTPVWLPIPIVLTISVIGVLLYQAIRADHRGFAQREAEVAVSEAAVRIEHEVEEYAQMASRLAGRVSHGEVPGSATWAGDVAALTRDFPGFERVEYDAAGTAPIAASRFTAAGAQLHLIQPVQERGRNAGYLSVTFDSRPVFRGAVKVSPGAAFVVEHEGRQVFGERPAGGDTITRPLPVLGPGWRVSVNRPSRGSAPLAGIVLASVLTLSALVGAVLWLAREADVRRRDALDVTHELDRRQHLLNLILDTLPVGVFITNSRGEIKSGNTEGRRIWGGTKFVAPDQYGEYKGWWPDSGRRITADEWALARALHDGRAIRDEVVHIEAFDGTRKTIQQSAVLIRELDGTVVGGVVVVQDVTARIAADRLLSERTTELERSNAELAQFAYVASHDLQEPLRMVSSYTQLLARRYRGRLDASADEFIGFAIDGAVRMQQLIEALLQYSRVGTQQQPFETVSMEAVFAGAVANLRLVVAECQATITHDPLPEVKGDAVQLTQLLQNLIGNGVKFHGDEPPRVHVTVSPGAPPVFSVEDNGIGIEPQFAERVFEIFQRLHTRDRYPGTGIGLAVCRKIVARHGGTIWVEPRSAGGGSVFRFTLQPGAARAA